MDNIIERIEKFNAGLLPDKVQLKYKGMAENAFRFFRGTCHLFYDDLSQAKGFPSSPLGWICGDLHLENFGSFKGNNRLVYFDLNDFDESMLSPVNWELARVLTSIYIAFDTLNLEKAAAHKMAAIFLDKYIEVLGSGKAYYMDPRTADGVVSYFLNSVRKRTEKELLKKAAHIDGRKITIKIDNVLHFKLEQGLKKELITHIADWLINTSAWPNKYEVVDAAFRVAGTGSIGLKRYMFLLQGKKNKDKFLLVELKQGNRSSLAPYNSVAQPIWTSEAERVITTKYRMQNISPALLSTSIFKGDAYVLQEMQPTADKINLTLLAKDLKAFKSVLKDMAILTASAQLRSSGIQGSAINDDLRAFAASAMDWRKHISDYASSYARQVKRDYKEYIAGYQQLIKTT
jgi:uncharacterized protein (DUF2252 family)